MDDPVTAGGVWSRVQEYWALAQTAAYVIGAGVVAHVTWLLAITSWRGTVDAERKADAETIAALKAEAEKLWTRLEADRAALLEALEDERRARERLAGELGAIVNDALCQIGILTARADRQSQRRLHRVGFRNSSSRPPPSSAGRYSLRHPRTERDK